MTDQPEQQGPPRLYLPEAGLSPRTRHRRAG